MIKNRSDYITSAEAAKILGMSHDYVRKLISGNIMHGEKLGRNWILNVKELRKVKRQRFPRNKDK